MVACIFQGNGLFHLSCQIVVFSIPYPFNVFRVRTDRTCFIADTGYLCLFCHFSQKFVRFVISHSSSRFHFIFFYVSLFSFSLISALTLIPSFCLFWVYFVLFLGF